MAAQPLSRLPVWVHALLSCVVVAFGQPAFGSVLSALTACCGYGWFWYAIRAQSPKRRFWSGLLWYALVQGVQLSWLLSHWYAYMIAVYLCLLLVLGAQFGCVCWLANPDRLRSRTGVLLLAGTWVLLEYSRLYWLTGLPFNPSGLALAANLWSKQVASITGVYGLSLLVLMTNGLFARALVRMRGWIAWGVVALLPYAAGALMLLGEQSADTRITVAAVDTSFVPEEISGSLSVQSYIEASMRQWQQALTQIATQPEKSIDLLLLPEGFVSFGATHPIYPYPDVQRIWMEAGLDPAALPPLELPMAKYYEGTRWSGYLVSNSYICDALVTALGCDLLIGMEAIEHKRAYNAAHHFRSDRPSGQRYNGWYGKQVLLPMAEYIPFEWLKRLAAQYGIRDSYAKGGGAQLFSHSIAPFAPSVCYEEIYGDVVRNSGLLSPRLLVNVTNDVWYPHSRLARQHWDHGTLRAVENGVPMVRCCNDGISGAVDAYGREIAMGPVAQPWGTARLLIADIPLQRRGSLYLLWGDLSVLCCAALCVLVGLRLPVSRFERKRQIA